MKAEKSEEWESSDHHIFWGEIAPTDHVLQVYDDDNAFLQLLEGFVTSGLQADECVVIIGTKSHLTALSKRLKKHNYHIAALEADDQLILLDAEKTLEKFMINGWPEAKLFNQVVSEIIARANQKRRRLRAFGEMVALLWARGENAATVHLETLWNRFCQTQAFCLFCAYPKAGFTQDINSSAHMICCAHSKMISGEHRSATQIYYKTTHQQAG